jgi:NIMA (never in mitosis gene a)-related kinase
MNGDAAREALAGGWAEEEPRDRGRDRDRERPREMDDGDRRRLFMEQKRAAQANRQKMREMEMGGGDAAAAMQPRKRAAPDEIQPPPKKDMNLEELNAYMREQRHIARANRARAEAAERGSAFDREPSDPPVEEIRPPPKKDMNLEERNAYMREQRHLARANRARAEAVERASAFDRQPAEPAVEEVRPPPKKDMNLQELNAYMREQRHIARANRARAEAAERGEPAVVKAMEDMSPEELNAHMKEQRERARAERERPAAAQVEAERGEEPPPPQSEKKPEMSLAEINAFMREQRHARRANRARAEAEMAGVDMDDLIRQAEQEQKANPPPPVKEEAAARADPPARRPPAAEEPPVRADPPVRRPPAKEEPPVRADPPVRGPPAKEEQSARRPSAPEVPPARADPPAKRAPKEDPVVQPPPAKRLLKEDTIRRPDSAQSPATKPSVAPVRPPPRARPPSEASATPRTALLLDQDQMRDLFQRQRDGIRANREKIKKTRDGAHEPEIAPSVEPHSARRPPALHTSKRRFLQGLIKPPEPESASVGVESPRPLDLSQALNKRSAGKFLKSRSVVLDQLEAEGPATVTDEENPEDLERQREMTVLLDQAKALNDALETLDNREPVDEPENEDQSTPFFLPNRVLNFPKVRDTDSLAYRAEAIRAFLEREIGLPKMLALRHAATSPTGDSNQVLGDCEAGVAILAQQLLVLEESIVAM